jgi:PAS domain S-box-containing protein
MKWQPGGGSLSQTCARTPGPSQLPEDEADEEADLARIVMPVSREDFGAVLARMGQLVWTASPDGTVADPSVWLAYTGQRGDAARGWNWLGAVHPRDRPRVAGAWRHAAATGSLFQAEFRVRRADGAYRWMLGRATPHPDAGGDVRMWVGVATDITERREAEEKPNARSRPPESARPSRAASSGDARTQRVGGDERTSAHRTIEAFAALTTMVETVASSDMETPGESVRAHATAQRLVERGRSVLRCKRLGIATLDVGTGTLEMLALADRSTARAVGSGPTAAPSPGGSLADPLAPDQIRRLRAGEAIVIHPGRARSKGRSSGMNPSARQLIPIRAGNRLVGVLLVDRGRGQRASTDIEQTITWAIAGLAALLLEAERLPGGRGGAPAHAQTIDDSTRRMGELLAIAAHELRAPATVTLLAVQMAIARLRTRIFQSVDDDDARAQLAYVDDALHRADLSMQRLARLIAGLLDAASIHSGEFECHLQPTNLMEVVRDAVDEQVVMNPARTIRLHPPGQRRVVVRADGDRIGQVVTNFLINALKYSSDDAPVDVRVHVNGGQARVAVQDNGPGLPADEQERVWERFHRAPEVSLMSGSYAGLGLGLDISKTIIEQHDGQVGVRSAPGKGSTFWFTVPMAH